MRVAAFFLLVLTATAFTAGAQDYPSRPVRVMVGASAGGLGGEPGALTLAQFADMNRAEYERFGALIRKAGIKDQ